MLKAELYKLASIPTVRSATQPGSKSQAASPHKPPSASSAPTPALTHDQVASTVALATAIEAAMINSSSIKAKPKKRKTETQSSQTPADATCAAADSCSITAPASSAPQDSSAAKPPQSRVPKKPKVEGSEPVAKKAAKAADVKSPVASPGAALEQSNSAAASGNVNGSSGCSANASGVQQQQIVESGEESNCVAVQSPTGVGSSLKSGEEISAAKTMAAAATSIEMTR